MRRAFVAVLAGSLASCVHAPAVTPPGSTLLTAGGIALEFELQVPEPQSVFVAAEYAEKDGRPDTRIWIEIVARDPDVHGSGGWGFCGRSDPEPYPLPVDPGTCVSVAQFDFEGEAGDPAERFRAVVHNEGPSVPVRLRIIHSPSRSPGRIRVRRGPLISN